VLHRESGAYVGDLRFLRSCEEIYDVQVLPGLRRPGILGVSDDTHRRALATPDQSFWALEREGEAATASAPGGALLRDRRAARSRGRDGAPR